MSRPSQVALLGTTIGYQTNSQDLTRTSARTSYQTWVNNKGPLPIRTGKKGIKTTNQPRTAARGQHDYKRTCHVRRFVTTLVKPTKTAVQPSFLKTPKRASSSFWSEMARIGFVPTNLFMVSCTWYGYGMSRIYSIQKIPIRQLPKAALGQQAASWLLRQREGHLLLWTD